MRGEKKVEAVKSPQEDVVIIGGGPCGLAAAAALQDEGVNPLVIEKGCIVNSIYHFPTFMQFFSTPELLEIGGVPFLITREKPTRQEALEYYRQVAARRNIRVHTYEKVTGVEGADGRFVVRTERRNGEKIAYRAKKVIVATGYYDNPNRLGVPGEELDKVFHYFKEAHPYHGLKVAVIGGKNSAVDACMELQRAGAEVTMIYRGTDYSPSIKPWVRPVFESLVNKGKITVLWNARVKRITERALVVEQDGRERELANDFVFALIGYRPDRALLQSMGVAVDEETGAPVHDPESMETNVPGIYIAGVVAAGYDANSIFIENGRFHGAAIARHLIPRLG
ncbi:YpdA family putative bacillithiol disulfide reductase [Bacillaceae bacterium]